MLIARLAGHCALGGPPRLTAPERHAWHLAQSVWHPDEAIATLLEATAWQMNAVARSDQRKLCTR